MWDITSFSGTYDFLSNFYPCTIPYEGIIYPSVEHAYQAAKTLDQSIRMEFLPLNAAQAKRKGRKIKLRADWNDVKLIIMYQLIRTKFTHHDLKTLLLDTQDAKLIEGNTWGDTFWGVCNGVGQNHLGQILMRVRNELNTE